jgi:DNA modification methylase
MAEKVMNHIGDLTPDHRNARKHTERNIGMIEKSLEKFGAARSIVVDETGRILAGNGLIEAAANIGIERVKTVEADGNEIIAVVRRGLTEEQKLGLAVADNRAAELADWDTDALKGLVEDGVDLAPFWTADELAAMWPQTVDLLTDEDDVPPVPVEPVSKLGDLYILGNHRLLCGDSTVLADVERLMGGAKADMVFTDPPYNVAVCGGDHNPQGLTYGKGKRILNDSMPDAEFHQFLVDSFTSMSMVIKDGATVYVTHADTEGINFRTAFIEAGFMLKQCLIWAKQQFVFGRSDYHWQHEPILYGWKAGAAHTFYGERNQGTVWNIDRPMRSEMEHPTQKPVALVEKAIGNSSKSGDILFEPFGGSGSTLIACEKTGRRAFVMEIDPRYTDVIVARWEQATGKKAVLSAG